MQEIIDLVRYNNKSGIPRLKWAEGRDLWVLRSSVAKLHLVVECDDASCDAMTELERDAYLLRERRMFTEQAPLSTRLPFSYQKIPPWIRILYAKFMGQRRRRLLKKRHFFPSWPLDLSVDFLLDSCCVENVFDQPSSPVVLTHDLDSEEGLNNFVSMFSVLERKYGISSTNYIVPHAWDVDLGKLNEIVDAGHSIGIHGHDHSNRTPFMDTTDIQIRLESSASIQKQFSVEGYRAPSLVRTRNLYKVLPRYFRYDSSIPTSGGLFPVPENGCASARPFSLNGLVEIPLSMPRDGSLRFLGHSPSEIYEIWKRAATQIAQSKGVIVLLAHCEKRFSGNPAMFDAYAKFLNFVANSNDMHFSTMHEVMLTYISGKTDG